MADSIEFRTSDHPEANGARPNPGDVAYSMRLPLEDGRVLIVHYGQKGFEDLTQMFLDMLAGTPSYTDGSIEEYDPR